MRGGRLPQVVWGVTPGSRQIKGESKVGSLDQKAFLHRLELGTDLDQPHTARFDLVVVFVECQGSEPGVGVWRLISRFNQDGIN